MARNLLKTERFMKRWRKSFKICISTVVFAVLCIMLIPLPRNIVFYTMPTGYGGDGTAYKFTGTNCISCFNGWFSYNEGNKKIETIRPGGAYLNPEDYPVKTKLLSVHQKIKILKLLKDIPDKDTLYTNADDWYYLADNYGSRRKDINNTDPFEVIIVFIVEDREVRFSLAVPDSKENEYVSFGNPELLELLTTMISSNVPDEDSQGMEHEWINIFNGNVDLRTP